MESVLKPASATDPAAIADATKATQPTRFQPSVMHSRRSPRGNTHVDRRMLGDHVPSVRRGALALCAVSHRVGRRRRDQGSDRDQQNHPQGDEHQTPELLRARS